MIAVNILITIVVGVAVGAIVREHPPSVWGPEQIFGLCLLAIGFILWTTARFQLGKSLAVTAQAKKLVTTGLYSKIRNPIYVFGVLLFAGFVLIVQRPILWLLVIVVVAGQTVRARREARVLEATFGDAYRAYRRKTWF